MTAPVTVIYVKDNEEMRLVAHDMKKIGWECISDERNEMTMKMIVGKLKMIFIIRS